MAERVKERKGGDGKRGGRMRGNGERTEATRRGFIWTRAISLSNFVGGRGVTQLNMWSSDPRSLCPCRKSDNNISTSKQLIIYQNYFFYKTIILSMGAYRASL